MKKWFFSLLCIVLLLSGCTNAEKDNSGNKVTYEPEEKEEVVYTSIIKKEECALCNKCGKTLLPAYAGQNNLGIICINTFEFSPVTINRYDDFGNLLKEKAGYMSMTHNGFGEGEMSTSVSADPDRGFASVQLSFMQGDMVDKKSVESLLCQDCLTAIMEESWEEPYPVGVINFETLEVRLFEENITGFTFGDYYIDIDRREIKDDSERIELDLLIFYCPPRYE